MNSETIGVVFDVIVDPVTFLRRLSSEVSTEEEQAEESNREGEEKE